MRLPNLRTGPGSQQKSEPIGEAVAPCERPLGEFVSSLALVDAIGRRVSLFPGRFSYWRVRTVVLRSPRTTERVHTPAVRLAGFDKYDRTPTRIRRERSSKLARRPILRTRTCGRSVVAGERQRRTRRGDRADLQRFRHYEYSRSDGRYTVSHSLVHMSRSSGCVMSVLLYWYCGIFELLMRDEPVFETAG